MSAVVESAKHSWGEGLVEIRAGEGRLDRGGSSNKIILGSHQHEQPPSLAPCIITAFDGEVPDSVPTLSIPTLFHTGRGGKWVLL